MRANSRKHANDADCFSHKGQLSLVKNASMKASLLTLINGHPGVLPAEGRQ